MHSQTNQQHAVIADDEAATGFTERVGHPAAFNTIIQNQTLLLGVFTTECADSSQLSYIRKQPAMEMSEL